MFFLSNDTIPFNTSLIGFSFIFGIGNFFINFLIKKLELNLNFILSKKNIKIFNWKKRRIINIFISKIFNINYGIYELFKLYLYKNYLIQTFRGRKMFMNKPNKGQRTRSNAKSSIFFSSIIKKKINFLLKKEKKFENKNINYFIKLKKKEKRRSTKKKKTSKLNILLKLKNWA